MAAEGYKGKVVKGSTIVLGMADWNYSGEEQRITEFTEFQNQFVGSLPTLKAGGEITIKGRYVKSDPGVALLQTAFDTNEHITDLKLYMDETAYMAPDPAVAKGDGTTFASYLVITKSPRSRTWDSAGIGQIDVTLKVVGCMKDY